MKDKVITLGSVFILHDYTRISKCQANSKRSGRPEKALLLRADIHWLLKCPIIWEWAIINMQFLSVLGGRALVWSILCAWCRLQKCFM